ncbi:MAG: hypothetical protein FD181_1433, partial [Prolixibacteraceae bacterium]
QEILENPLGIFLLFPCSKFNHFVNLPVVDKQLTFLRFVINFIYKIPLKQIYFKDLPFLNSVLQLQWPTIFQPIEAYRLI